MSSETQAEGTEDQIMTESQAPDTHKVKDKRKKILEIFILLLLIGNTIVMLLTFSLAFLSGHYSITITINDHREAIIEAIIIPLITILGVYLLYSKVLELRKESMKE